jgi:hypothetical protein
VLLIVVIQSAASGLALAFWKHRPADRHKAPIPDEAFDQEIGQGVG